MDEMAQQANDLPAGWVWTTIGEVTDTTRKRVQPQDYPSLPFVGMEHVEAHAMRVLSTVPASEMRSTAEYFEPGDVLYGRLRPYLNKVFCAEFTGLCSGEFIAFRKVEQVASKFLLYFLNSWEFVSFASHLNEGDRPRVNIGQLASHPFPLAPLPEQHRIVAEIETQFTRLDAGVAALKRAQAKLRRYKAAVLKAACEGRLVPTEAALARTNVGAGSPRPYEPASALLERILAERRTQWQQANPGKRYVEPKGVDADGLADLPEGWVWAKLDQLLVELKNGYFGGRPEAEPPGIPILRVSAVRPMSVSFDDPRYLLDVDETKQTAYLINEGDLFFTRYNGSRNLVGACGLVRHAPFAALYPDKLIRALVLKDLVLPGYLEAYFNTDAARDYIEGQAKTTAGQYGIAGNELRQATVALPPLSEQHRIIAEVERRLSVAQEVESTVTAGLKRAERLRQSILKRAFEGRLVPQDPSDEPATVPLERPQSLAQ